MKVLTDEEIHEISLKFSTSRGPHEMPCIDACDWRDNNRAIESAVVEKLRQKCLGEGKIEDLAYRALFEEEK